MLARLQCFPFTQDIMVSARAWEVRGGADALTKVRSLDGGYSDKRELAVSRNPR